MSDFWNSFNPGWSGWLFMWILAVMTAFMVAVAAERFIYIFGKANLNAYKFMGLIRKYIAANDYKRAVALCQSLKDKALAQVVYAGINRAVQGGKASFRTMQNAIDEGTLEVIPKLQARTGYLAMIGNVATLVGLMGTIYGLIIAFRSVSAPGIDVAEKSRLLAHGIAVAMNTTLFGLAVAIPAIIFYTILHNKTNQIIDEIDEHTVKLINMMTLEE